MGSSNAVAAHGIKFGTDGWRAIIAEGFTFHNVERVARGIGAYVEKNYGTQRPILIGYDTRFMGDKFAAFAQRVLESMGFTVLLTDEYLATPILAFAAKAWDSAGALMFTASHNPPEYCGIKYIPPYAGPATPDITKALLKEIDNVPESILGNILAIPEELQIPKTFDPVPEYTTAIAKLIDFELLRKHPINILHDPMYGSGQGILHKILLDNAGWGVSAIHDCRDTTFGGQIPEPKGEYLEELAQHMRCGDYQLGIANDGDADRIGVIDEHGVFYGTNWLMPMLLWYLHSQRGFQGGVVRTVATSMILDALASQYGIPVEETPVGFKYVGQCMREKDIIIGGEESGGISILGHIPEKDGILAALLIAEMMAATGKNLGDILNEVFKLIGQHLHQHAENLHLPEEQRTLALEKLARFKPGDAFGGRTIEDINRMDGTKLIFGPFDWILLRPSGTEPILRLYGESPDPEQLRKTAQTVLHILGVA